MTEQRRRVGAIALRAQPGSESDWVRATAARLRGGGWPSGLALTAVEAERGERVVLREGDGVELAVAVAASRAIPGLRPVVTIGAGRYMDGAVGSATNADLATGAAQVVIVTPNPAEAPSGAPFEPWEAALRAELALLEEAGADVALIQAGAEDLEAMGPHLMSGDRARQAYAAGRRRAALALASA